MNQLIKRSANIVAASAMIFGIGAATMFALPVFAEDDNQDQDKTATSCAFEGPDNSNQLAGPNTDDLK